MMAKMPLSAHTVYFRDAIGNVSSSQLMRTAFSVRNVPSQMIHPCDKYSSMKC